MCEHSLTGPRSATVRARYDVGPSKPTTTLAIFVRLHNSEIDVAVERLIGECVDLIGVGIIVDIVGERLALGLYTDSQDTCARLHRRVNVTRILRQGHMKPTVWM